MKNLVKLLMPISGSVLIWSLSNVVMPNANALPRKFPIDPSVVVPPAPSEIPCSTFLQSYIDWLKASSSNRVVATVADNVSSNGVVTYSLGTLNLNGNSLTGTLRDLLSNRTFCPETAGGFGFGRCIPEPQPFSVKQPSSSDLMLPLPFPRSLSPSKMVCYNNGTAIILYPASTSVVTLLKGTDDGPPR